MLRRRRIAGIYISIAEIPFNIILSIVGDHTTGLHPIAHHLHSTKSHGRKSGGARSAGLDPKNLI